MSCHFLNFCYILSDSELCYANFEKNKIRLEQLTHVFKNMPAISLLYISVQTKNRDIHDKTIYSVP